MTKLYQKDEVWFAVVWIIAYVIGTSIFDSLDTKLYTLVYHLILCSVILVWIKKERLFTTYGLCKPTMDSKRVLYYLPLFIVVTCNLWFGIRLQYSIVESFYYVISMFCVGFLEEMLFRGFLFKAISKDNMRSAIMISSLTFGIGHIVNLFNGSGVDLLANLCQVGYAITFGYLFVVLFVKTKSLVVCMLAHAIMNMTSVFANVEVLLLPSVQIVMSVMLLVVSLSYAVYIKNA